MLDYRFSFEAYAKNRKGDQVLFKNYSGSSGY